ncbi:MAG: hypothetical protein RL477_1279, partial [Pseudomonadota bacterium]
MHFGKLSGRGAPRFTRSAASGTLRPMNS